MPTCTNGSLWKRNVTCLVCITCSVAGHLIIRLAWRACRICHQLHSLHATTSNRLIDDIRAGLTIPGSAFPPLSPPSSLSRACIPCKSICCSMSLRGAGLDIPSKDGSTPLHVAAEHGAATCLALLLKGGAKVDAQDGQGRSPVAVAAAKGHTTCVLQLLGRGATVVPGLVRTCITLSCPPGGKG